jgi:hypothetical protein
MSYSRLPGGLPIYLVGGFAGGLYFKQTSLDGNGVFDNILSEPEKDTPEQIANNNFIIGYFATGAAMYVGASLYQQMVDGR